MRKGHVTLRVLVGGARFATTVHTPWPMALSEAGLPVAPCGVRTAGDRLTFVYPAGCTARFTLFDFLDSVEVDLGLQTTIEYVGKTANPATRPTNLAHRGLAEAAHSADPVRDEIAVLFNTFHVHAGASKGPLTVMTSNSLTNELDVRPEAEFIEKMLIDYFEPAQQRCVLSEERARLRRLDADLRNRGVGAVDLVYEVDAGSDLYRIGSARIPASRAHHVRRDLETGVSC